MLSFVFWTNILMACSISVGSMDGNVFWCKMRRAKPVLAALTLNHPGSSGGSILLAASGADAWKWRDRTTQASLDSIGPHVKTNHTPGDTCNSCRPRVTRDLQLACPEEPDDAKRFAHVRPEREEWRRGSRQPRRPELGRRAKASPLTRRKNLPNIGF